MKAIALLGALLLPVAAVAQPVDSRIPRDDFKDGQREDSKEVRKVQVRYGDCVVRRAPQAAARFVLAQGTDLDRRAARRMMDEVVIGECLVEAVRGIDNVQMRFPNDTMRYTLADALARSKAIATGPLRMEPALPALAHPTFNEAEHEAEKARTRGEERQSELERDRARSLVRIFLSSFGECVVRANPAGAHALLSASVVTPEENRAFAALGPAFGQCLTDGNTVSLNKALLRGTVALNYYRLAHAAGQVQ